MARFKTLKERRDWLDHCDAIGQPIDPGMAKRILLAVLTNEDPPAKTIAELLATPDSWTDGQLARGSDGEFVSPTSPMAVCWCLLGAIEVIYPVDKTYGLGFGQRYREAYSVSCRLQKSIAELHSEFDGSVQDFNDADGRTHEEILAVVKHAGV